jgi:hypothetical protein
METTSLEGRGGGGLLYFLGSNISIVLVYFQKYVEKMTLLREIMAVCKHLASLNQLSGRQDSRGSEINNIGFCGARLHTLTRDVPDDQLPWITFAELARSQVFVGSMSLTLCNKKYFTRCVE